MFGVVLIALNGLETRIDQYGHAVLNHIRAARMVRRGYAEKSCKTNGFNASFRTFKSAPKDLGPDINAKDSLQVRPRRSGRPVIGQEGRVERLLGCVFGSCLPDLVCQAVAVLGP